jgi:hypothetical protein
MARKISHTKSTKKEKITKEEEEKFYHEPHEHYELLL